MRKILFFTICVIVLLASCTGDLVPLQVDFTVESTDCAISDDNTVATLSAELQITQGDNVDQLGFRVSAFTESGDDLPINRVVVIGFNQYWNIDDAGTQYFVLDGISQIQAQVFFVSPLPAERVVTVIVELIDQSGSQLTALSLTCLSTAGGSVGTESCANCTTRLAHDVTNQLMNSSGLHFGSSFSEYDECPIRFELSVTGQVIDTWEVSGGSANWEAWTYAAPTQPEFDVFIPASELAEGYNQIRWRIFSSAGTLLDGQSFGIDYDPDGDDDNSNSGEGCRIVSHKLVGLAVNGNSLTLKTRMETGNCSPSHQIYLDVVEVLSSTLDIQTVQTTTPGAPGANFNSNGPWSIHVPDGQAEFTVVVSAASIRSGDTIAFNLSDYDHDIIVQVQATVP